MRIEELAGKRSFVVHEFFSAEECAAMIERAEGLGFGEAPINAGLREQVVIKEVRNNSRAMVDDFALAESLWGKLRPFVPDPLEWWGKGWTPVGLNERFRFYRYEPGERFAPHRDGHFSRGDGEMSLLTFMIYLNEGCGGGSTRFYGIEGRVAFEVRPETGKVLVFLHGIMHEGAEVEAGRKYVLRSDVMFRELRVAGVRS